MFDRRKFIQTTTLGAGSLWIPQQGFSSIQNTNKKISLNLFTKPLDKFGADFMMDTIKLSGLDGLDLTVRPKGCVLPEKVERDLPKVAEGAKNRDLGLEMMVTNINSIHTPHAEKTLTVAKNIGIKHYRLGYYRYNNKENPTVVMNQAKDELEKLVLMNQKIGIQGGYQNHSGNYFGAPIWDLLHLLKNTPMEWMSSQYDIRHGVCEGYKSWWVSLQMLAPKIGSLAIKDFTWQITNGTAKVKNVPLGEGIVDFDLYFQYLKSIGIIAPITIHVEYPLLDPEEEQLPLLKKQQIIVSKLKNDVEFIKSKLIQHQIS